jgi:hypothetical protein
MIVYCYRASENDAKGNIETLRHISHSLPSFFVFRRPEPDEPSPFVLAHIRGQVGLIDFNGNKKVRFSCFCAPARLKFNPTPCIINDR